MPANIWNGAEQMADPPRAAVKECARPVPVRPSRDCGLFASSYVNVRLPVAARLAAEIGWR